MQAAGMLAQEIVVYNYPARVFDCLLVITNYLNTRCGIHHQDLTFPVQFQRGRANDQNYAARNCDIESNDGLSCLSKAHCGATIKMGIPRQSG